MRRFGQGRTTAAIIGTVMLLATQLGTAQAAPAEQGCVPGAVTQADLAGSYTSTTMMVNVYPCGGTAVTWMNAFGQHSAVYGSKMRLDGGGVGSIGIQPSDVGYLDGSMALGLKPAERGYIQVFTIDPYGGLVGVYRLQKIQ